MFMATGEVSVEDVVDRLMSIRRDFPEKYAEIAEMIHRAVQRLKVSEDEENE